MKPNRRGFLKSVLAAGVAPLALRSGLRGEASPSNRLSLGFIGLGGHGLNGNLRGFLAQKDCEAVAICDVFRDRMDQATSVIEEARGASAARYVDDFRDMIADPQIDAVVISTPDHWHVPMSTMALAAGKHVFCEKPTYCIAEGKELAEAVERSGKTFQTGLEDRSLTHYHRLVEWVKNGAIGDFYHVEVTLPEGSVHPGEEPVPVPDGLNWRLWLGPAPFHPYTPTRTRAMHWRFIRDYSTGMITDWGTHLVDTAQLAVDDPLVMPTEVKAWGEEPPSGAQTDLPARFDALYRYSNGVTMQVTSADSSDGLGKAASIRFLGSNGWVAVNGWRGKFEASDPRILKAKYKPAESKHFALPPREHRNFLDCIRSGSKTTYPAATLHSLSTTLHMGLIAMDLNRPLRWDPIEESFVGDEEANRRRFRRKYDDWQDA